MQIIIDLNANDDDLIHSCDAQKENFQKIQLTKLLIRLESDSYQINSLYGRFIFDLKKKEVVDCGMSGERLNASFALSKSILETDGRLAIIFTDKKYIVFANSFFIATSFCNNRKVRPLSINKALNNYDELILHENEELLNKLYFKMFESFHGKGVNPFSNFFRVK